MSDSDRVVSDVCEIRYRLRSMGPRLSDKSNIGGERTPTPSRDWAGIDGARPVTRVDRKETPYFRGFACAETENNA